MTVRVGRQELLYGAERLISPLDWANTRRTFEGVKLLVHGGDWKADAFYTHLVPVVPNELDRADYEQPVYGVYSSYSGFTHETWDLFYIGYDNEHPGAIDSDFSLHTFGGRVFGSRNNWLYEAEGGVQVGRQSGLGVDHNAGYATVGLGRKYPKLAWQPTIWCYYDYASGNAGGGSFNRFNPLFPLGHKYFGFIDAVQRSNIESPNVLVTAKPGANLELLLWYWHFMANQSGDIVPSIGGTPNQSLSRTHLGDELDVTARYWFGPRSNILFGYSHFWRGDKILAPQDADFFYTQWELNF
ncbi:MAG TPA: alginate export family protein, partial [Lacipirellulaceae bacterium]